MKSHNAEKRAVHIDLIEAQPKLLPNMPKPISAKVALRLHKLGVRMYLNSKVEAETVDELRVSGRPIRSHTVIWTAGVTNHPFFKENNFSIMGRGKVGVDAYLQSEPNVFVLGDNANTPFSGMAQTAIHDGDFVANNLIRRADNKDFKSYEVKKPISVIPAGGHWAVVLWGKLRFSGYSGYLIREAADLLGFHDIEPWPKAFRQFLSEFSYEDDCPICAKTLLSS
jgi:NADH dehydrogenase